MTHGGMKSVLQIKFNLICLVTGIEIGLLLFAGEPSESSMYSWKSLSRLRKKNFCFFRKED